MWYMRQCDGGNRSNAAVLCGALDAELQHLSGDLLSGCELTDDLLSDFELTDDMLSDC